MPRPVDWPAAKSRVAAERLAGAHALSHLSAPGVPTSRYAKRR